MAYRFIEGLTVADVAFEATGRTLDELFESSGKAVEATMVKTLSSVRPAKATKLSLSAKSCEQLLHDFLEELVFLKDAKMMLYSKFKVNVISPKGKTGKWKASGTVWGQKIDPLAQELLVDVKAVTWHKFSLEKGARGNWKAVVVLDV